jgi:hypothetical protein
MEVTTAVITAVTMAAITAVTMAAITADMVMVTIMDIGTVMADAGGTAAGGTTA